MMPEVDGIEVCRQIKAMPQWSAVPIIMVTALTAKQDLAQCIAAGADDFVSKPVNRVELTARMRSMLRIHQQYQLLSSFNTRLTQTVEARTAELQTMIFQDGLTQLASREKLLRAIAARAQADDTQYALVYLDCDQFKLVNGSFGYGVGNELLIAITHRLQQYLRPGDVLARMGEDEFCYLLHQVANKDALSTHVETLLHGFNAPFSVANCDIFMTVCIGSAMAQTPQLSPAELVQAADTAMYQAKLRGKGSYQMFDHQMHLAIAQRLTLENDLQRALEREEFIAHYQPIVDLMTQQVIGFEALVRWRHTTRGMVSPGEFIPNMETTGLIVPVGIVILRQACQQLHRWHQQGWTHLTMSVNLSVRQFACPTLLRDIDHVLAETEVNPARLKLEITESAIMENADSAIALLEELRDRGIQISLDDFGTGYCSLGYLHRFPINTLKIDRSFVNQIQTERRNYHVVDTIVALSKQLDLTVTAEGIETVEQMDRLRQLGCEFGQGYLFSKPLPTQDIEAQYLANRPLPEVVKPCP